MYTVKRIKAFLHLSNVRALLTTFTVSLIVCGCTDDGLVSESSLPVDNSAAVISLNVKQQASDQVRTRAFDDSSISNLYILVYNGNGSLIGYKYLSSYTSSIQMDVNSGTNCTIYSIANLGSTPVLNAQTANTESALKAMMCGPVTTLNGVITNERLTMSGSIKGITLLGKGSTNYVNSVGTITISRLVAKNTFTVTAISGITITGYSIKNLPKYEYLVARPNANESFADDIAVGNDALVSERFDVSTTPASSISNLTFYMFENRRGGRAAVNGSTGTSSAQKEKGMYAPNNATYMEIYATGTLTSTDVRARFTSATYRIYFGADNSQNYNVKRNGSYNYNVNITGATDIDTRVTKVSSRSNCYIVPPNRAVIFPVSRANDDGTTRITNVNSGWTAELLWTDNSRGLDPSGLSNIKSVTAQLADGTIKVETGRAEGNAVVVAKVNGIIVWSWHIWVTSYDPNVTNKSYNSKTFMDRNLGAVSNSSQDVGSLGLLYQWGRKDPFPGASGITSLINTAIYGPSNPIFIKVVAPDTQDFKKQPFTLPLNNIDNSIKNPLQFYYTTSTTGGTNKYDWYSTTGEHDDNLWGATGSKSVYDPSPEGWRVPKSGDNSSSPWNGLIINGISFTYGYNWTAIGWYPAVGCRYYKTGDLTGVGLYGVYWSASVNNATDTYSLYLSSTEVRTSNLVVTAKTESTYRSYGFPIRCVKD
ncbi:DUF4906 domain-containing protein [uncultured Bacteroides sp.]|uniref:DUF4906 domain-containing protein n=1 Tax=uncultured Bacteroides sp. TaxID=162156 RepID=UPI002AAAAC32|nr:DUF4906 domain-containing protein [uncultured Bacteroides sp.]